ncbi:MAG: dihydropyrimidinase [Actinobacteria bacterium]|nr:dihydropyrimidinase [Actinomycetota bacterium]MCL5446136.1 dihydropyrimidinase [Actinomycetota bacterium]
MSRILIEHGTVVTASGTVAADVLVEGEKIAALLQEGTGYPSGGEGLDRIDATGKLVVPGGIDVHTHMEMPFGGSFSSDTFATGTEAAAWGGTTTIVDFAIQPRGGSARQGLETWMSRAEGQCAIDYGFHLILSDVTDEVLEEMQGLVRDGITSYKLFMAYPGVFYSDDGQILRVMQTAAACGATVMMHAENGIAIDVLVRQALEAGQRDPRMHGETRPSALEGEATHRAIILAQVAGCPLYIVHLSAAEALAEVVQARDRGQAVSAETCPQYLFLDESLMAEPDFEGAKYVCSPPIRAEAHRRALWQGIQTGDLSVVATDHCPFCFKGQKELGRGDFTKIPNGLPVVEHRMDLIYQGVVSGRITPERWVELTSTAPARLFGMYPQKGTLLPGADADLVIYDPSRSHDLGAATHHMAVDYSVFEGLSITGAVDTVISRGTVLLSNGVYRGHPNHGRFVPRNRYSGPAIPTGVPGTGRS